MNVVVAGVRRRVIAGKLQLWAAKRSDSGLWEFPGGKVEPGEFLPEALQREWFEEFSVAVEVGSQIFADDKIWRHQVSEKFELQAFWLTLDDEITSGDYHSDFGWFEFPEILDQNWCAADLALLSLLAKSPLLSDN